MSYLATLNNTQKQNAKLIIDESVKAGVTNAKTIGAFLSIASKESGFIPKSEDLNYSKERILQVWPNTPPAIAAKYARNPVGWGNYQYGGKFGNSVTEGFIYRGRGFNQITFKARYKQIGDRIKLPLVANPDLLNIPANAAKAFVAYYLIELGRYKIDPNSFKTTQQALDTIYQANAGKIGKPIKDTTGGYAKAASRVDELISFVGEHKTETGAGIFFLAATATALILLSKNKNNKKQKQHETTHLNNPHAG